MQINIYLLFAFCGLIYVQAYKIPNVKLEILSQGGFRVSIPDEPGVKNVAFNINRNRSFKSFEPGEYSAQISSPIGGFWSYENKNTRNQLDSDDTIYIWTNVQHNHLVYRRIEEPILVNQLQVTYNNNNNNNDNDNNYNDNRRPYTNPTTQTPTIDIRTISSYEPQTCEASITKMQNRKICKGELIFEENFELGLNLTRWQYEVRFPLDMGDAEFVLYDYDIENIKAANGVLTITPTLWNNDRPGTDLKQGVLDLESRCTGMQNRLIECKRIANGSVLNILPPIKTARINTKHSFSFKYGRVEIRAKLPRGDWIFPLLLLEPLTNYYGITTAYASGQLRIAFARGNANLIDRDGISIDGRTLYGGAILSKMTALRERFLVQTTQLRHFSDDYHVYTMIWSDRKLVLKVDDREYGTIDGGFANNYDGDFVQKDAWKVGEFMAPFDQEFYITLGVAAGGHGDFPDNVLSNSRRKPWANTSPKAELKFWRDRSNWKTTWNQPELKVDYVRIFAI